VRQGEGSLIVGGDVKAIKTKEIEARQRMVLDGLATETKPELDQFMEAHHKVLVKFREELTRPLQEAMKFMQKMEPQLNSLSPEDRCATPFRPSAGGRSATPTNTSYRWAKTAAWRMQWGVRC
jgi:hypothetical protein